MKFITAYLLGVIVTYLLSFGDTGRFILSTIIYTVVYLSFNFGVFFGGK